MVAQLVFLFLFLARVIFRETSTETDVKTDNNILLSPEGEVNGGEHIPRRETSQHISSAMN